MANISSNRPMSLEEALPFAEQLVDCVLYEWSVELYERIIIQIRKGPLIIPQIYTMTNEMPGMPPNPPVTYAKVSEKVGAFFDSPAKDELADAMERRDRKRMIELVMRVLPNVPKEFAPLIVREIRSFPVRLRQQQKVIAKLTKVKSGRHAGVKPHEYERLAMAGARLAPLVEKIDAEIRSGTKRTVAELIHFWEKDFPDQSSFLSKHLERFQSALKDTRLSERARKPKTRATAIADAMAGAEDGFSLSTSYEKAREGRRIKKRIDMTLSAKNRPS